MLFRRKKEPVLPPLSASNAGIGVPNSGAAPKKILIVDDDPVMLKTLSTILKSGGYQVVTATDGGEAISQVRDEQPDLLLVDVCLPPDPEGCGALGWDGFQIARWIRNLNCKAPAIMISGTDKPQYRKEAVDSGARGFLAKPIDIAVLLSAVSSTLSSKQGTCAIL